MIVAMYSIPIGAAISIRKIDKDTVVEISPYWRGQRPGQRNNIF